MLVGAVLMNPPTLGKLDLNYGTPHFYGTATALHFAGTLSHVVTSSRTAKNSCWECSAPRVVQQENVSQGSGKSERT